MSDHDEIGFAGPLPTDGKAKDQKKSSNGKVEPKPTDLDKELGIGTSLPMSSWESYLGGENLVLRTNAIDLDALVEMRQKDGQVRALLRLLTLPILKATETAEWVEADTDNSGPEAKKKIDAESDPTEETKGLDSKPKETPADKSTSPPGKKTTDTAPFASDIDLPVPLATPPVPVASTGPPKPPTKAPAPPGAPPPGETGEEEEEKKPTVLAPPKEEPEVKPEIEFANLMWTLPPHEGGMSVTAKKLMRQILLGLVEGFSVFEEVRYVPEDGPLKGKIVLKKLAHRDARTVKFRVDDKGGYDGIRQKTTFAGRDIDVVIPKDKSWYWAANEEENPYYGVSYFEAAWHHWQNKRRLYYIAHVAAQFAAVPGRIGKVPPSANSKEVEQFKKGLRDFAFNTSMAVPIAFEVEFANQNTNFNFLDLINHHNGEMAKSVLAKFLNDEERTVLIDTTQDQTADFFVMQLEAMMDEIGESITHYVMPKYIDWNFGSETYPVLKFPPINDATKDVIKEMLVAVATAQSSQLTEEFIREMEKKMAERLGLDVDYEAVDAREAEDAKKAEEDAKKQFEAQFGPGFGAPPPGFGGGGPGAGPMAHDAVPASHTGLMDTLEDLVHAIKNLDDEE